MPLAAYAPGHAVLLVLVDGLAHGRPFLPCEEQECLEWFGHVVQKFPEARVRVERRETLCSKVLGKDAGLVG